MTERNFCFTQLGKRNKQLAKHKTSDEKRMRSKCGKNTGLKRLILSCFMNEEGIAKNPKGNFHNTYLCPFALNFMCLDDCQVAINEKFKHELNK